MPAFRFAKRVAPRSARLLDRNQYRLSLITESGSLTPRENVSRAGQIHYTRPHAGAERLGDSLSGKSARLRPSCLGHDGGDGLGRSDHGAGSLFLAHPGVGSQACAKPWHPATVRFHHSLEPNAGAHDGAVPYRRDLARSESADGDRRPREFNRFPDTLHVACPATAPQSYQARSERSIKAKAPAGPQLPAA